MTTPRWIVIVAAVTLLAVFSWRLVVLALVAVACFEAFNRWQKAPSSARCAKCGEPMKSTQRWCQSCGAATSARG